MLDTFKQENSDGQNELSGQMVSYILFAAEELTILNDWKKNHKKLSTQNYSIHYCEFIQITSNCCLTDQALITDQKKASALALA